MNKSDCKICIYSEVLYTRDRKNPEAPMKAYGRVMCSAPRYKGRKYLVREKAECDCYKTRERGGNA